MDFWVLVGVAFTVPTAPPPVSVKWDWVLVVWTAWGFVSAIGAL
jgi:hypothetical protein